MQLQVRRHGASQRQHAHVLHDDGIGARLGNRRQRTRRLPPFVIEYQRVERDKPAHTTPVQSVEHLGQFGKIETSLGPRREVVQTEIHRIGARLDGRPQLGPVAGGGHYFRLAAEGHGAKRGDSFILGDHGVNGL